MASKILWYVIIKKKQYINAVSGWNWVMVFNITFNSISAMSWR